MCKIERHGVRTEIDSSSVLISHDRDLSRFKCLGRVATGRKQLITRKSSTGAGGNEIQRRVKVLFHHSWRRGCKEGADACARCLSWRGGGNAERYPCAAR